jgi:hypothetical protein
VWVCCIRRQHTWETTEEATHVQYELWSQDAQVRWGENPPVLNHWSQPSWNAVLYVYVCVCIYMCIHTHTHTHTHTHSKTCLKRNAIIPVFFFRFHRFLFYKGLCFNQTKCKYYDRLGLQWRNNLK